MFDNPLNQDFIAEHTSDNSLTNEVGDRISRDRIITLADALLAIVMTLLVIEIVVRSD